MYASLNDPLAKLDRAKQNCRYLQSFLSRGAKNKSYGIVEQRDPNTRLIVLVVDFPDVLRDEIGLRIGEIAHNLRSGLDHLVWQLVKANGVTPGIWNAYPIAFKVKDFSSLRFAGKGVPNRKATYGISSPAEDFIKSTQPYPGTSDDWAHPLWNIKELNNTDKHEIIPVMIPGYTFTTTKVQSEEIGTVEVAAVNVWSPHTDSSAPAVTAEHGADLSTMLPLNAKMDVDVTITQKIVFAERVGLERRPVMVVLRKAIREVERILADAAQFF